MNSKINSKIPHPPNFKQLFRSFLIFLSLIAVIGCEAKVTSTEDINSPLQPPVPKEKYTIAFYLDGGAMTNNTNLVAEEGDSLSLAEGGTWKTSYTPKKVGHSFQGWFSDPLKTKLATPKDYENYKVTNDAAFYAKWQINRYQVTFNVDGGSAVAAKTINHGQKITAPFSIKANANESFYVEWYSDAEKNSKFNFASTITEATTLYAKWLSRRITAKEFNLATGNDVFSGFDFFDGHLTVFDNADKKIYFYSTNDGSHQSSKDISGITADKIQYIPSKNGFYAYIGDGIKFLNSDGTASADKDLFVNGKTTFYPDDTRYALILSFYSYENRIILAFKFFSIPDKIKDFSVNKLSVASAKNAFLSEGLFYTGKNSFYSFSGSYTDTFEGEALPADQKYHEDSLFYYDGDFQANAAKNIFLQKHFSTTDVKVQINPIVVGDYLYVLRANSTLSIKKVFVYYVADLLGR